MSLESKIIKISYQIRAVIEILDTKEILKVDLPIILTIIPKSDSFSETQSLPPSYSDCEIFQHMSSEDLCIPLYDGHLKDQEEKSEKSELKELLDTPDSAESSIIVDLPPSYAEAVFGSELYRY